MAVVPQMHREKGQEFPSCLGQWDDTLNLWSGGKEEEDEVVHFVD